MKQLQKRALAALISVILAMELSACGIELPIDLPFAKNAGNEAHGGTGKVIGQVGGSDESDEDEADKEDSDEDRKDASGDDGADSSVQGIASLESVYELDKLYTLECRKDDSGYDYTVVVSELLPNEGIISTEKYDLDGDGENEIAAVSYGDKSDFVIEVYEPDGSNYVLADKISLESAYTLAQLVSWQFSIAQSDGQAYIIVHSDEHFWLNADGIRFEMKIYEYDGKKLSVALDEGIGGSDFEGTQEQVKPIADQLKAMGFDKTAANLDYTLNYSSADTDRDILHIFAGHSSYYSTIWMQQYYEGKVGPGNLYIAFSKTYYGAQAVCDSNPEANGDGASGSDYIFPDSSGRLLTDEEVTALSDEDKRLARNEIYARHGRRFKDEELQAYFDSKPWYYGFIEPGDFSEDILNQIEKDNVKKLAP